MSTLSQFRGHRRITKINGSSQAHGLIVGGLGAHSEPFYSVPAASQLQTVLSVTGAGALNIAAASTHFSTTVRMRITLDGFVVVDRSVYLNTGSVIGLGFPTTTWSSEQSRGEVSGIAPHRSPFMTSCLVEISTAMAGSAHIGTVYVAWDTYE